MGGGASVGDGRKIAALIKLRRARNAYGTLCVCAHARKSLVRPQSLPARAHKGYTCGSGADGGLFPCLSCAHGLCALETLWLFRFFGGRRASLSGRAGLSRTAFPRVCRGTCEKSHRALGTGTKAVQGGNGPHLRAACAHSRRRTAALRGRDSLFERALVLCLPRAASAGRTAACGAGSLFKRGLSCGHGSAGGDKGRATVARIPLSLCARRGLYRGPYAETTGKCSLLASCEERGESAFLLDFHRAEPLCGGTRCGKTKG